MPLYESGLGENWKHDTFGHDEIMVDWIAMQDCLSMLSGTVVNSFPKKAPANALTAVRPGYETGLHA